MDSSRKKRKTQDSPKIITYIVCMHSSDKKWLVEWSDKTRTWESYDNVKNLSIFQDFLREMYYFRPISAPSYIN